MQRSLVVKRCAALSLMLLAVTNCRAAGCPDPQSSADARDQWEANLDSKAELKLDATRDITIKRDVHSVVVNAEAGKLADAFHQVMRDPKRHFGLIRVDRKQVNIGKPFTKGERFQGRYELDAALKANLLPWEKKIFGQFVNDPGVRTFLCNIENQNTSDYGLIAELNFTPREGEGYVLSYHYLEGSPIAGSSTFVIAQVSPGLSSITQIFEYQELTAAFALFFSSGGLKLHNQVVYSQAVQAAEILGAKVVSSDIPDAYRTP